MTIHTQMSISADHIRGAGILNGTLNLSGPWGWKLPFVLQYMCESIAHLMRDLKQITQVPSRLATSSHKLQTLNDAGPLPLAVILIFAPDSPWWLMRHGQREKAIHALDRLSDGSIDNGPVASMIAHTIDMEKQINQGDSYLACFRGTDRRRTEIAIIAWVSQNLVGFAMQSNQIYFFTLAGLASSDSFKLGLGTYCIAGFGTLGSMVLMSHIGRRKILLWGFAFMLVMMLTIGVLGCVPETGSTRWCVLLFYLSN